MNIPVLIAYFAGLAAGNIAYLDVSGWWYLPCGMAVMLAFELDHKE